MTLASLVTAAIVVTGVAVVIVVTSVVVVVVINVPGVVVDVARDTVNDAFVVLADTESFPS